MMIVGVALLTLPTMAQEQEWKSTSAMPTSGSAYSPKVNAVGATGVSEMATTTSSSQNSGPRKAKKDYGDNPWGDQQIVDQSQEDVSPDPLGDAVLPLLLMAVAFGGYIAIRRKKRAEA